MVEYAAYVGWDWGQQHHAVDVAAPREVPWQATIEQKPEAIRVFVEQLRKRYGGAAVALCIEQGRGAVMYALMQYEFLHLVPINPRAVARYREAVRLSGATDDPTDAWLIRELVQRHPEHFAVWSPDDPVTRELRLLSEWRRKLVDQSTATSQQLRDTLLQYFPQVLEDWVGELKSPMAAAFLEKWPTLESVQRARPDTVRRFYRQAGSRSAEKIEQRLEQIRVAEPLTRDAAVIAALSMVTICLARQIRSLENSIADLDQRIARIWAGHPDHEIFAALPGAGPALGPRLAVAFGTDRAKWANASSMQCFSGVAPVVEQSGKQRWVHARWQCPTFVRQTFHEFAGQSIKQPGWAREFYDQQRAHGCGHHAALRALAFRWIRVIYRCWKDRKPYDVALYSAALRRRGSPLAAALVA